MNQRVHKTMMNAKVGLVFYFVTIFIAFYSRRIFLQSYGDDFKQTLRNNEVYFMLNKALK